MANTFSDAKIQDATATLSMVKAKKLSHYSISFSTYLLILWPGKKNFHSLLVCWSQWFRWKWVRKQKYEKRMFFFRSNRSTKKSKPVLIDALKMQYEFTCIHFMDSFSLLVFLPPSIPKLARLETHVVRSLYMKCSDNTRGIGWGIYFGRCRVI